MKDGDAIKAAIEQRFSRVALPAAPPGPWRANAAPGASARAPSRRLGYACAVLGILVAAGVAAQASGTLRRDYARLLGFGGSPHPLPPLVHRADRLTLAQAQQRVPFAIVVPTGLPPQTRFQYATVGEHPTPRVGLVYQTVRRGRYYRIVIDETTVVSGPAKVHVSLLFKGKDGRGHREEWTLPLRRWKHGTVIMEMIPQGLPAAVADRIVRENTLTP
ncbi:MAG: hypothetical protein JOZ24_05245 [Candidatus Eremiobacteraeota bacterium]|nr:hypothetical protein [Candidatus Eremiobacteraeota bacterium]